MGTVFLDMAMSLDGFVAGANDEDRGLHDWYFAPSGNAVVVIDELLQTIGAMIIYLQNLGGQASIFQQFVSTAGLVSVITSVLTAAFVGLLIFALLKASLLVCLIAGGVVFGASVFFSMRYQHIHWKAQERDLKVLFPSERKPQ